MEKEPVIIVGGGPSGIAISACLNLQSIPNIILEREDCFGSLWRKRCYDRLHLHIPKQYCELPHMSYPKHYPKYVSKNLFIEYMDSYVSHFNVNLLYYRSVESAIYDEGTKKWCLKVKNINSGEMEEFSARFLVAASGGSCNPFIPAVEGLSTFHGEYLHSTKYRSGSEFSGKSVLVVGSGNSGMEISLDLSNYGAKPSIVIRSPFHILTRRLVHLELILLKYLPYRLVDSLVVKLCDFVLGDITKYGLSRPKDGPYHLKAYHGKFPVIDVGTFDKIKSGEIQVVPAIKSIRGDEVEFVNGKSYQFDVIVFATGFNRTTNKWLMDDYLLDEEGIPKPKFPNHWKGRNGLYCVGLGRSGLYGASTDAINTANDINNILKGINS